MPSQNRPLQNGASTSLAGIFAFAPRAVYTAYRASPRSRLTGDSKKKILVSGRGFSADGRQVPSLYRHCVVPQPRFVVYERLNLKTGFRWRALNWRSVNSVAKNHVFRIGPEINRVRRFEPKRVQIVDADCETGAGHRVYPGATARSWNEKCLPCRETL
jgi:hypothetical protein